MRGEAVQTLKFMHIRKLHLVLVVLFVFLRSSPWIFLSLWTTRCKWTTCWPTLCQCPFFPFVLPFISIFTISPCIRCRAYSQRPLALFANQGNQNMDESSLFLLFILVTPLFFPRKLSKAMIIQMQRTRWLASDMSKRLSTFRYLQKLIAKVNHFLRRKCYDFI